MCIDQTHMTKLLQFIRHHSLIAVKFFPEIYSFLDLTPIKYQVVRIVRNLRHFSPHSDSNFPTVQVRTLLPDDTIRPSFYYMCNNKKVYQTLPEASNAWAFFKDSEILHGSDFHSGYRKLLVMYFGSIDETVTKAWFQDTTFDNHSIKI